MSQPPGGGHQGPPAYPPPPHVDLTNLPGGGYTPPPGPSGPVSYQTPGPGGPPPPPGYPGQPAPQFNIGDALSWSWSKFTQNAVALIVGVLSYVFASTVLIGATWILGLLLLQKTRVGSPDGYGGTTGSAHWTLPPASYVILIVGHLAAFAVLVYMNAGLVTGCLDIADGKPVAIASFFKVRHPGAVLLTALLVLLGTVVLSLACVIPGLIFGFVAQFAIPYAVDRSLSPIESIKGSYRTARAHLGDSAIAWLVETAVNAAGQAACVIGMFASMPIGVLLQIYTYRHLSGGQIDRTGQTQYGPAYRTGPARAGRKVGDRRA